MNLLKRKPQPQHTQAERRQVAKLVEPIRATRQRVDVDALTLAEAEEMNALHVKARDRQEDGLARAGLEMLTERERRRFLELLDKALPEADRERRRLVSERRERRTLERFANEVANAGVPPRQRLGLLDGEVLLPPAAFTLGSLHVGDIGLLSLIVHAWSSGDASVFVGGRWSDDGTALLTPKRLQLRDPAANRTYNLDGLPTAIVDLARTLDHLTKNAFLVVSRDEHGWTIRRGPRLPAFEEG